MLICNLFFNFLLSYFIFSEIGKSINFVCFVYFVIPPISKKSWNGIYICGCDERYPDIVLLVPIMICFFCDCIFWLLHMKCIMFMVKRTRQSQYGSKVFVVGVCAHMYACMHVCVCDTVFNDKGDILVNCHLEPRSKFNKHLLIHICYSLSVTR